MPKETYSVLLFFFLLTVATLDRSEGLLFPVNPTSLNRHPTVGTSSSRRSFVCGFALAFLSLSSFPEHASAKSYSANARNLERMNTGDMSGGSTYDNNPRSDAGKRRRAITGCKSQVARGEAAKVSLKVRGLSEKECNQIVLDGNSEFMLETLRNLDCPSCPYGISTTRKKVPRTLQIHSIASLINLRIPSVSSHGRFKVKSQTNAQHPRVSRPHSQPNNGDCVYGYAQPREQSVLDIFFGFKYTVQKRVLYSENKVQVLLRI